MTNFSDRLRKIKRKRGLTAKEIASACGVSMQTVYGWTQGKMPKNNNLAILSTYLNVTTDYLINGTTNPKRAAIVSDLNALIPQLNDQQLHSIVMMLRTMLPPSVDNNA